MNYEEAVEYASTIMKNNHYREQDIHCCDNCAHKAKRYENMNDCELAMADDWDVAFVDPTGICNAWKEKTNETE